MYAIRSYYEFSGGNHGLAAAFTAVADKIHALLHIFPKLDQIGLIGLIQQRQPFLNIHGPGMAVPDQRSRCHIKGHANFLGCLAGPFYMGHFVTAVTDGHLV